MRETPAVSATEAQDKVLKQLGDAINRYKDLTGEMEQGTTRAGILSQALRNIAENTEGAASKGTNSATE